MDVTIEERDVRAVCFSLADGGYAKLLAEAATFLESLKGHGDTWMLLGMNHQSDEFGDHLTLFLERRFIAPSRPPTDAAHKEPVIRYL